MGRRTLIEYLQTPDVNFFLCRRCRTHIALTQELVCRAPADNLGFFRNLVNVEVDGSAHYRRDGDYTGADIYCYTCDSHLGWKFFEVPGDIILLSLARFLVLLYWMRKQMNRLEMRKLATAKLLQGHVYMEDCSSEIQ